MANARLPPPRRRSMTDAFSLFRNPDAANAARNDLINTVEGMRQRSSQLDDFARALPKVTESDLASLGQSDGTCPICLTSLLAVLAEEETAIAMDSPAHPIEELGVTRLAQTCGHIFCRKDIRGWLYLGHSTCPTCRTPFIAGAANVEARAAPGAPGFEWMFDPRISEQQYNASLEEATARTLQTLLMGGFPRRWGATEPDSAEPQGTDDGQPRREEQEHIEEAHFEYDHDRSEFSGMYS